MGSDTTELNELKEKVKQLEMDKISIAKLLVNTTIANIELMDTYIPQWRFEAKDAIEKLQLQLRK